MLLRLVPDANHLADIASNRFGETSNAAPALQDTLRTGEGPVSLASKINNRHPLEARITNWEETQFNTRMEMYRRVFGAGAPIKQQMDLAIVDNEFTPMLNGELLHRDVLVGKDSLVDWEDIYKGSEAGQIADFHGAMEKKMGL